MAIKSRGVFVPDLSRLSSFLMTGPTGAPLYARPLHRRHLPQVREPQAGAGAAGTDGQRGDRRPRRHSRAGRRLPPQGKSRCPSSPLPAPRSPLPAPRLFCIPRTFSSCGSICQNNLVIEYSTKLTLNRCRSHVRSVALRAAVRRDDGVEQK